MSWHPFERGKSYAVQYIISTLLKHLESGKVKDLRDKARLVGLLDPYSHQHAVFEPIGTGWGSSPYNISIWRKEDGSKIVENYNTKRKRKAFSEQFRLQVIAKTGGYCYSCGEKFESPSEVWIEHIIPFSVGGSDEIANLLPGCRICNWTRRNYSPHQIRRILSVGAVTIRQIDKDTELGKTVYLFLESEDSRRSSVRKTDDPGFLIYKTIKEPNQALQKMITADTDLAPSTLDASATRVSL